MAVRIHMTDGRVIFDRAGGHAFVLKKSFRNRKVALIAAEKPACARARIQQWLFARNKKALSCLVDIAKFLSATDSCVHRHVSCRDKFYEYANDYLPGLPPQL
jgi:hypothetical protein